MATIPRQRQRVPRTIGYPGLKIRFRPRIKLTDRLLAELSSDNDHLRFEVNAAGELIVMTPTGESGASELNIASQLHVWAQSDGSGRAYGATTAFRLPSGALYAPDAAWVLRSRLEAVPLKSRQSSIPLCPDFVIELRSPSDRLRRLQRKMNHFVMAGVRLGWLIDPVGDQSVYIYGQGPVQQIKRPAALSGEPVLQGFKLDLCEVWPSQDPP